MSHEIELRFHIPAEALPCVRRWLGSAETLRLQARYFDTADRRLAQAGIGLRLRCEGGRWVQTVKGPSANGLTRGEHNVELDAEPNAPEPALHAEHPLGAQLATLLSDAVLQPTFATDITRSRKPRRLPGGARIEIALDEGCLLADGREQAVHELELELLAGPPGALLAYAHGLLARLPLSLDQRSKAERGERLARGEAMSPPRKARAPQLKKSPAPAALLRGLLLGVIEQIAANASQIGSGASTPEHLQQLRVGLRRLRALLALMKGAWPALDALELAPRVRDWARLLGAQRDADVQLALPGLDAALQAAGYAASETPAHDGGKAAAALVRDATAQQLLLEVMGTALALDQLPAPALRWKRRLRRWTQGLRTEAAAFARQDAEARHQLRKRAKRLRYALELTASLRKSTSGLKRLRALQAALGELNDIELALLHLQTGEPRDPRRAYALGWLQARHTALLRDAALLASRFVRA